MHRLTRPTLAALALALGACHDATAPRPELAPIAYSSDVANADPAKGHADLHVVAPDGGHERRLTHVDGYILRAAWSPDGRRLVFDRNVQIDPAVPASGFASALWTADADGSHLTRLPATFDGAFRPAWSPDGTRLVYRQGGIHVARVDGSAAALVVDDRLADIGAQAWSPDGTRILYSARKAPSVTELWTVSPDGSGSMLLPLTGCTADGAWSPGGRSIAFSRCDVATSDADGSFGIDVAAADGSNRHEVAGTDWGRMPVWSPDGRQIAFLRATPLGTSRVHVLVVSADGGEPRDVTPDATFVASVTWRP